ncbi:MAG: InlB B-repeat-containing protein [Alphaproteobacteria bacterium]|nr:InlB B-repeat-containing protein [Alphaproteobacteria bacterium]
MPFAPSIERTGYIFDGWSQASGNTTKAFLQCNYNALGVYSGTAKIPAEWEPINYTVTYTCGDGTGTPPADATATYDDTFTPSSNAGGCTKENHDFAGWKTGDDDVSDPFKWLYLSDKTFEAQWAQGTVTCSEGYMEDGTKCQAGYYCPKYTEAQPLTNNEDCAIKCPDAGDLDGVTVPVNSAVGATKRTQCVATYDPIDLVVEGEIVGKATKSCYYSTESGVGSYLEGACTTTPTSCVEGYYRNADNSPTCTVVPAGWYSCDDDENHLTACYCRDLAADNTLAKNTATSAIGATDSTKCYYKCLPTDTAPESDGVGTVIYNPETVWYDGNTYPACNKSEVRCEDTVHFTGKVLTETCDANVYSITYFENGGTNNPKNPMSYTYISDTITLVAPTRANSVFKGWYGDSNFKGDQITQISEGSAGDKTLYAKWSCVDGYEDPDTDNQQCVAETSTITLSQDAATAPGTVEIYTKFDAGAYLDEGRTQQMTTGENGVALPQQQYVVTYKSGADGVDLQKTSDTISSNFNGYYSAQTGGTQYINANGFITSSGVEVASALYDQTGVWYAQWTPNAVTLPVAPERTGYTFAGWYDGAETLVAGAEYTVSSDVTFTAKWTPIKYTIEFENGDERATGTMAKQECEYDTTCILYQNKFELENFGFENWLGSDGNEYADKEPVKNLASTDGATVTMTAQWTQEFYVCTEGFASDNTQCADGYYCPGGKVAIDKKDSCQRKCPADNAATSIASDTGASAPTQCYAAYEDVRVEHGSVNKSKCYYDDNAGKYSSGCNITVKTCDAGYYRVKDNATDCEIVPVGSFSAKDDLEKTDCGSLAGAIEGKTLTEAQGSERATQCYNVCDNQDITNGELVATGNKFFNDETQRYPACEYTTVCDDNYTPNGSECLPNVYKVNLDPASNDGFSEVYVKYNVGWFENKDATQELTSVELPTESGRVCTGYSVNNQTIIDEGGQFITTTAVTANDTEAIAQWNDKDSVTCEAGTYYSVAQKNCVECQPGNYCPNPIKVYIDETNDVGMYPCDTAEDAYTAATDANGNKLVVSISSPKGAKLASECYATNLAYVSSSNNATGAKTCRYNTTLTSYDKSDDCDAPKILTCTAGHYLKNTADTDCTQTESGYYSADKELDKHDCPHLGTEGYSIATVPGATQKGACYLQGAWSEPDEYTGQRGDCYWNVDSSVDTIDAYNTNCQKTIIVTCGAGYYDNKKNYDEDDSDKRCSQVQTPFYSPAESAFCDVQSDDCLRPTSAGKSTIYYPCPDGGETKENGAGSISECYASVACTVDGGGTGARTCAYNPETGLYDDCDAKHATVCKADECPTGFELNSDGTACVAKVYDCEAGKYFNGATMVECPANSYCDGTGTVTFGSEGCVTSCPTEYPNSVAGANSEGMCYKTKTRCSCISDLASCAEKYGTFENLCFLQSSLVSAGKFDGVVYANTTKCVPAPDAPAGYGYCAVTNVACPAYASARTGMYFKGTLEDGYCTECNFVGEYMGAPVNFVYTASLISPNVTNGAKACFAVVDLPCTRPVCPGEGAESCTFDGSATEFGGGYLYNDGTNIPKPGKKTDFLCPDADWTCKAGYDKNANANNNPLDSGVSQAWELCLPHMSTITLNLNYSGAENQTVYQTYNRGWFDNVSNAESAVNTESASQVSGTIESVTPPTRQGYTFGGYYTKQYAGEAGYAQVIPASGELPANTTFTSDAAVYAKWVSKVYTVTLNHNGGASDVDAIYQKYDIGWFDDAAAEKNEITKIAIPTKTNSVFMGYFADGEGNAVITADGVLPANNTFDSNVTLTAQWSDCPDAKFGENVATAELDGVVDNVCQYVHTCKVGYWNTNNNKAVASVSIDCSACTAAKPDSADWNEDLFTADACTWTCKPCVAGNGVTSCDVTQTATTCDYSIVCNDNHIKTSDVHAYQTTCAACPEHSTADDGQDGCYCDNHYNGGERVEIGGVCPADIYTITLNPGYADATDVKIYQKWLDAFYKDKDASQAIDSVSVLNRGSAYRFDGYFTQADDSQQDGATDAGIMVVDATGQIVANANATGDTTWYAHWTGLTYDCEPEYYFEAKSDGSDSVKKSCYAPYYCDGTGVVTVGETGCISTCPAGGWLGDENDDGEYVYRADDSNATIASCHKYSEHKSFVNGTALSDCYYTNGDEYSTGCMVVPLTCDAGYYYPDGSGAAACSDAGSGYYSPAGDLKRTACPELDVLGAKLIGSNNERADANDCYIVCDKTTDDVPHSVAMAPKNNHEYYNGAQYNACYYEVTQCADGYTPKSGVAPACNPKTYDVTFYKFAGSDEVVDTVQCTFDSKQCMMPSVDALVRPGYVVVPKWCDANGKCYDANVNTEQNISATGDNIALYAQWESDVFEVQLVATDADENAAQGPIYLKYNVGWFADANATQSFEGLVNLPGKDNGAYVFAGYKIGEKQIIDMNGAILAGTNTVVTDDATATVMWSNGNTVCAAGYYYPGNGNADNCTPCLDNYYCSGGTFGTDSGTVGGLVECPDGGLSDGGVSATSDAACYKVGLIYNAKFGAGTQTCFYKDGAYNDRCQDIEIQSCVGGYYYDADATAIDCVEVGHDYYSAEGSMERFACPSNTRVFGKTGDKTTAISAYECFATVMAAYTNGSGTKVCNYTSGSDTDLIYNTNCREYRIGYCDAGYYRESDVASDVVPNCAKVGYGNYSPAGDVTYQQCPTDPATGDRGNTATETAGTAADCFVNNTPYPAEDYDKTPLHGQGYQTCSYTIATGKYDTNCGTPTFTKCDAGYWNDGIYVNADGARDCALVGEYHYSPADVLERSPCLNGGTTGKDDAADITECYLNNIACDIQNGTGNQDICYYETVGYTNCSDCYVTSCDETFSQVGNACVNCTENHFCTDGQEFSCDEETSGQYPLSQAGATDVSECYRLCDMADNATEMSGAVYQDGTNTCEIVTCGAGYMLEDGKCVDCPAGSVCDGNGGGEGGDNQTCATLTGGTHTMSDNNVSSVDYCYRTCDMADNATEMSGRDYYTATDTCEIVTCDAGYMLENGVCVDCPAGSVCGGNGPDDVKTCTALTGGKYPLSDANASSIGDCYKDCESSESATMVGRDYYDNSKHQDTCTIATCNPGYIPSGSECLVCPEGSVCTGDPTGTKTCAELTNNTHIYSETKADNIDDCYTVCKSYDVVGGTAIPVNDIEFYPAECKYRGESDTGNPCDIVDGVCVETSCNYNYEMINGRCEPCNREHAITYKQGGNCVVESCVIGYHPYGQECAEDVAECAAPNAVAATQTWDVRTNAFGPCMITECESGYHLAENVCQLDEQVCELPHGVGMREWNHNSNRWGDCVATKCDPGYTNDPAQTNQLWEQCGECANKYSAYGQVAASSYVDECEIAACLYQGELYNLENNECVQICTTYSDETGSRRWNPDTRKCEHDCADGYMMW